MGSRTASALCQGGARPTSCYANDETCFTNPVGGIEKGTPAAWATRSLIEAFVNEDARALESAENDAQSNLREVTRDLIVVAGGCVRAFAHTAQQPFDEVLASIWAQFAQRDTDTEVAQLMRASVTAWCRGDERNAEFLNESGAFTNVDPSELILHFLGFINMVMRRLAQYYGEPIEEVLTGVWRSLGTEGLRPE
jgi:hypothetical protein